MPLIFTLLVRLGDSCKHCFAGGGVGNYVGYGDAGDDGDDGDDDGDDDDDDDE